MRPFLDRVPSPVHLQGAVFSQMGPSLAETLARRIASREASIGVIGMGYVGLPLARTAAEQGFRVVGLDIDRRKVKALNAGRSYISHISSESLAGLRKTQQFSACSDFACLAELDVVIICVPTPLNRHREPDLSFIVSTAQRIRRNLRRGQLVILESTTYPGTTNDVLKPILESSGLDSGIDFFLAYSPEREDPGNKDQSALRIPKIVGGDGSTALDLAAAVYDSLVSKVIRVSSPEAAEAAKLTENIFRAVNIALANELKLVFEPMGIDIWEVIEAAKTKPFGFMPFYPGPGLGGHCIPIDPFYLTWKAREFGIPTRFIELAGEINNAMPRFVVDRLSNALDQNTQRGLNGASILVVGLAYKKNVDDMRESPSLRIIELIENRGGRVDYYDPFIPKIPATREHSKLAGRRSIDWVPSAIELYDAVVIATDHDEIDYAELSRSAKLILDTRNAIERAGMGKARVVKA